VLNIKEVSEKIQKLEVKMDRYKDNEDVVRKLRKERYDALEDLDEYRDKFTGSLE
jgi:hypothetical protein